MLIHPVSLLGFAIFVVGALLFATQLFKHGGLRRSVQFEILGKLIQGVFGARARMCVLLSFPLLISGMCLSFSGVLLSDRARLQRCEQSCTTQGFSRHRIGANSNRDPNDKRTWFVACICEADGKEAFETRADAL